MKRQKMTYKIILSENADDFGKRLNSNPKDYNKIDLSKLIKKARAKGIKRISGLRIDFDEEKLLLLNNMDVCYHKIVASLWSWELFLNKEEYKNYLAKIKG